MTTEEKIVLIDLGFAIVDRVMAGIVEEPDGVAPAQLAAINARYYRRMAQVNELILETTRVEPPEAAGS